MPAKGQTSRYIVQDGIIDWYQGPEWDDVAAQEFQKASGQIEAQAKSNAPWEDRTGMAREKLHTEVEEQDGIVSLSLEHGVEYGFWLEVIQQGRFAIIMPTLEEQAPRLFRNAARRIQYARRGRTL